MLNVKSLALACATLLPTTALADWNGPYVGGSVGSASNIEQEINNDAFLDYEFQDRTAFGGFLGTRTDAGNFVYGGEVALEFLADDDTDDANSGGADVDYIFDINGIAGVPLGDALAYAILSVSVAGGTYDAVNDMSASGIGFGAGAAYKLNDNFSISGEYLSRSLSEEFEEGTYDVTADTITFRAAYNF